MGRPNPRFFRLALFRLSRKTSPTFVVILQPSAAIKLMCPSLLPRPLSPAFPSPAEDIVKEQPRRPKARRRATRPMRPSRRSRHPSAPTLRRILPAPLPLMAPRAVGTPAHEVIAAILPSSPATAGLRPPDPRRTPRTGRRIGIADGSEIDKWKRVDYTQFSLTPRRNRSVQKKIDIWRNAQTLRNPNLALKWKRNEK